MFDRQRKPLQQSGLVIVMLALVLVVLLGVAALALDLGRLYVLKSEMQNAADAAALAAAAELDGQDDAIERARYAAKDLLKYNSHFSTAKDLLGSDNVDIKLTFYCSIGSSYDKTSDSDEPPTQCTGEPDPDEDDENKILISNPEQDTDDEQAHYVKVTLDPNYPEAGDNEANYGIDLYFLPVLSVIGIDTANRAVTAATALAGRHFYVCNYPPMMICDPMEGEGGLRDNLDIGSQIVLKKQGGGSTWDTGMFGFLYPRDPETKTYLTTNKALAEYLADEKKMGCTPPRVKARGGNIAILDDAWDTRFDIEASYPALKGEYEKYPPDINISEYGGYYFEDGKVECPPANYCNSNGTDPVCWRDSALRCIKDDEAPYVGDGVWDAEGYWQATYGEPLPSDIEDDSDDDELLTRYEVYKYEIDPNNSVDYKEPVHEGSENRRVLYVAVLSCGDLGIGPNDEVLVSEPDGFAKFFMTEQSADLPSNKNNFIAEYMGWTDKKEANYHVVVQLYE